MPEKIPEILEGEQFYWMVTFRDIDNMVQVVKVDGTREKIEIEVRKGSFSPISLSAVMEIGETEFVLISSWGFIYGPNLNRAEKFCFSVEWGFESFLFHEVSRYISLEWINVKKLIAAINERTEGENHWVIDSPFLIENLICGDFRIYDIRTLRERTIEIILPEGTWLNGNISGENIMSESALLPVKVILYTGSHKFYNKSGLILEIVIREDGAGEYIIYN